MKKYKENMSKEEYADMLKEILALDDAYVAAERLDADFAKLFPANPDDEPTDEMGELRKAALNHRGEP